MSRDEVFKVAIRHIEELVRKNNIVKTWSEIREESHFFYDLGFDSLDMTELIMDLEASLYIKIPDNEYESIVTVSELVTLLEIKTP